MDTLGMEEFPDCDDKKPAESIIVSIELFSYFDTKRKGGKVFDKDSFRKELQMAGFSEKEPFLFEKDSLCVAYSQSEFNGRIISESINIFLKDHEYGETLLINQFPMPIQEIVLKQVPLSNLDMGLVHYITLECKYDDFDFKKYSKTLVANGFVRQSAGTRKKYPIFTYKKDNKDNTVWEFETTDYGWNEISWTRTINK